MSLESIFIDRSAPGQGKILKTHLEAPGSYLPLTCCPEGACGLLVGDGSASAATVSVRVCACEKYVPP